MNALRSQYSSVRVVALLSLLLLYFGLAVLPAFYFA
jgi:hypothetical protein